MKQTELFGTAKQNALNVQLESGKMISDKKKILGYAKMKGTFFLPEVIKDLGIPHKSASGRLSDLEDIGLLKKGGRFKTKYKGKYSMYTYVSNENEQLNLAHERKFSKFMKWRNRAEEFKDYLGHQLFTSLTT